MPLPTADCARQLANAHAARLARPWQFREIQVFAVSNGLLVTRGQTTPGGPLSGWYPETGPTLAS